MKIVAGKNRGNKLKSIKGLLIRPTSHKVREALFDIIGTSIQGAYFLDLFSGTGAIGIEALSRGADKVIFVEKELKAIKIIKENLEITKNNSNAIVYKIDFLYGLKILAKNGYLFDYIFLDPPYNMNLINISLVEILKLPILNKNGIIIAQHHKREEVNTNLVNLKLIKQKKYGECNLSLFNCTNL